MTGKKINKRAYRARTVIAVILSVVLLVVFAYLALRHYDDAVQKLYASETESNEAKTSGDFQSSVNIVKN